jgi:hypothetical protein
MALKKSIELNNGVIVNYHRIVSIYKTTNHSTRLEIASYINKDKREQEKEQIANGDDITVYMETEYISLDYDETSNIKDWYEYLKTTDKYGGSEDV